MTPYYESDAVSIFCGDSLAVLREMPSESVNCCITSPPYWGLRDYGRDGQMGLESKPEQYVANMVAVFAEVRRVMKADGTLWLNIGDSYWSSPNKGGSGPNGKNGYGEAYARGKRGHTEGQEGGSEDSAILQGHSGGSEAGSETGRILLMAQNGIKPKDLVGIPWMLAFALRADGWYLRQDIIWSKPNPMPESVTDRCTKAHEYLFLLSKSARYYYNASAIAEASVYKFGEGGNQSFGKAGGKAEIAYGSLVSGNTWDSDGTRNKRSVWEITTQPFAEAHFATFPEDLIKPCILAGCPVGGTVLDPFGGSMTTMKVARDLNCKGIAIELNAEYIEIGKRRLSQEVFDFEVQASASERH